MLHLWLFNIICLLKDLATVAFRKTFPTNLMSKFFLKYVQQTINLILELSVINNIVKEINIIILKYQNLPQESSTCFKVNHHRERKLHFFMVVRIQN